LKKDVEKKLLEIGDIEATDEMMQKAASDVPKKVQGYYSVKYEYKFNIHITVKIEGNWMAVAFFYTENMRLGAKRPVCILFMEHGTEFFVTYDIRTEKWSNATIGRYDWKWHIFSSKIFFGEADKARVREFLQVKDGDITDINQYQDQIRYRQLKRRHKKETDPWDAVMEKVHDLPKDWEHWVAKSAITEHFIFYQYQKKVKTGYCTRCEKIVPISKPRHNKEGRCPCCRRKIKFKAFGRAGRIATSNEYAYLLQSFEDKMIVREFKVYARYEKGDYENPKNYFFEVRRVILDEKLQGQVYYYGVYKQTNSRWIKDRGIWSCSYYYQQKGQVYRRTLPVLSKGILKRTGLREFAKQIFCLDPEYYLYYLKKSPYLERLSKAGLGNVVNDLVSANESLKIRKNGKLAKALGIDGEKLKRLRGAKGGIQYLEWLQEEKKQGEEISEKHIKWFIRQGIRPETLDFITDKMSVIQIYNYLIRQHKMYGEDLRQLIITWRDYLSMAKSLGVDTSDEIIFRASKLKQRHQEMVRLMEERNIEEQAEEYLTKYPNVNQVCSKIKEKYEYLDDKTYAVLVPNSLTDILKESRNLHHCASGDERYYDRINREETYILFLRKKDDINVSYYTLEVEPGGTVRQKRTEYDRQKADIADAVDFLKRWQKIIRKRMTLEDARLAKISEELRAEEFKEMRKKKLKVRGGDYAGRMLADVLQADLMEFPGMEEKEAA